MSNKSYSELLKDPRWQKKRLEILELSGFSCQNCGDTESTLHVHHGAYLKGRKPWEYPDQMLHCLCDECHDTAQSELQDVFLALGFIDPAFLSDVKDILTCYGKASDRDILAKAVFSFCQIAELDEKVLLPLAESMRKNNALRLKNGMLQARIDEMNGEKIF